MIRPGDPAFEDREVAFNRVGVHVAANVLASRVTNDRTRTLARLHTTKCLVIVRVESGIVVQLLLKDCADVLRCDGRNMMRANRPAALNQRNDRLFTSTTTANVLALAG